MTPVDLSMTPLDEMREALAIAGDQNAAQGTQMCNAREVVSRLCAAGLHLCSYAESLERQIKELEAKLPGAIICPKCNGRGWYANSVEEFMKGTVLCEQCDGNGKVKP